MPENYEFVVRDDCSCEACTASREQENTVDEDIGNEPPAEYWNTPQVQFFATNTTSAPIDSFSWTIDNPGEEENLPEIQPEDLRMIDVPQISGVYITDRRGNQIRETQFPVNEPRNNRYVDVHFWTLVRTSIQGETYQALVDWANEVGVILTPANHEPNGLGADICWRFRIDEEGEQWSNMNHCSACEIDTAYPLTRCTSCNNSLYCKYCRKFRDDCLADEETGDPYCGDCGHDCESCGEVFSPYHEYCPHCNPHRACAYCDGYHPEGDMHFVNDTWYCGYCNDGMCHECNTVFDAEAVTDHRCHHCIGKGELETFDSEDDSNNTKLDIPVIPGREIIRLCGVEIEGASGNVPSGYSRTGDVLAHRLFASNLSANPEMNGYHYGGDSGYLVHVERDSSVDWEMVIGPINFADSTHVTKLNKAVEIARGMVRNGEAKLDMRGGLHVHVSAEKAALADAYNLHMLYMYNEDFLYRLGAAKWNFHRAIPKHGEGHAKKSPQRVGKLNFAREFAGDRYYGLSFENYFQSILNNCRCGARQYGMWEECTCDLNKCTFEFRLFNTTVNTTKIHAYLAICQSLVAKAISMDEIKNPEQYPALDFIPKKWSNMTNTEKNHLTQGWEERIQYFANELPLTMEEKRSIYYCVQNSDVGKAVSNASLLLKEDN